jgi:hypothetical protein
MIAVEHAVPTGVISMVINVMACVVHAVPCGVVVVMAVFTAAGVMMVAPAAE